MWQHLDFLSLSTTETKSYFDVDILIVPKNHALTAKLWWLCFPLSPTNLEARAGDSPKATNPRTQSSGKSASKQSDQLLHFKYTYIFVPNGFYVLSWFPYHSSVLLSYKDWFLLRNSRCGAQLEGHYAGGSLLLGGDTPLCCAAWCSNGP